MQGVNARKLNEVYRQRARLRNFLKMDPGVVQTERSSEV
jgi:hypothetical protein